MSDNTCLKCSFISKETKYQCNYTCLFNNIMRDSTARYKMIEIMSISLDANLIKQKMQLSKNELERSLGSSFHGMLLPLSWSFGDGHRCLFSHDCSANPGYFAKLVICYKCLLPSGGCYYDMWYWVTQEAILRSTLSGCLNPSFSQHSVCWDAININWKTDVHRSAVYVFCTIISYLLYKLIYSTNMTRKD